MAKDRVPENVARFARALLQIAVTLREEDWQRVEEEAGRGESWFAGIEGEKEHWLGVARSAAREIVQELSSGAELPAEINREQLVRACMKVRQDENFDVPEIRMILDHAALVLASRRKGCGLGTAPPCPEGIGLATHERLWALTPDGWFSTGDLARQYSARVSERRIRTWCRALVPRYLDHNEERGRGSRYRRK